MTISKGTVAALAAAFIAGAAAGAAGGGYLGVNWLLNNWVHEQTFDIETYVEALRKLKAGQAAQAIDLLEQRLDADLLALEPDFGRVDGQTRGEMQAALRAARQYRAEHPRKTALPGLDESIRKVLEKN
jgi:hypothetical protein